MICAPVIAEQATPDAGFHQNLQTGVFYRQHSDEPFQLGNRAEASTTALVVEDDATRPRGEIPRADSAWSVIEAHNGRQPLPRR
jgi:hypothetical protein